MDGRRVVAKTQVTQGEALEVTLKLETPAGVPVTSATGVVAKAKPPAGAAVRTYSTAPGTSPGEWLATILFDLPGRWWVSAECSGPTPAIDEVMVEVTPRQVA